MKLGASYECCVNPGFESGGQRISSMASYRSRRWRWLRRLADLFDLYVFPKAVVGKYGEINWAKCGAGDRYYRVQVAASKAKYKLSWAKKNNCEQIVQILQANGQAVRSM